MTRIAVIGEAYGAEEAEVGKPFVGSSGKLLTQLLGAAGIEQSEVFLSNVFNVHPPRNDVEYFFGGAKDEVDKSLPKYGTKFLLKKYRGEIDRLYRELSEVKPNVIIALGNTPSWALLGQTAISKIRGFVAPSPWGKVVPTYHLASLLREWNLRPTVILDLQKAKRESRDPAITRPSRVLWLEPSLGDLDNFEREYLVSCDEICIDIETNPKAQQITCIGFAPSPDIAIVVPFWDWRKPGWSYWPTFAEEFQAWLWCKKWFESPKAKLNQNILFDAYFSYKAYGLRMLNIVDDTMLMQHSMYPESQKDLGYLASITVDEMSWKSMRKQASLKKEE